MRREARPWLRRLGVFIARWTTRSTELTTLFRAFLRQKLTGRFAFGGVEALVAVLVELLHERDIFAHAAGRPAKSARASTTGGGPSKGGRESAGATSGHRPGAEEARASTDTSSRIIRARLGTTPIKG
jgi:hypothetical protein